MAIGIGIGIGIAISIFGKDRDRDLNFGDRAHALIKVMPYCKDQHLPELCDDSFDFTTVGWNVIQSSPIVCFEGKISEG